MAFDLMKFRKVQRSGMNTWWSYVNHTDNLNTIKKRDYFENVKDRFAVGDWVFCTASNGGVLLHVDEIDPLEMSVSSS
jgi:hypothetical protein